MLLTLMLLFLFLFSVIKSTIQWDHAEDQTHKGQAEAMFQNSGESIMTSYGSTRHATRYQPKYKDLVAYDDGAIKQTIALHDANVARGGGATPIAPRRAASRSTLSPSPVATTSQAPASGGFRPIVMSIS